MGMFTKGQQATADTVYSKTKQYLKEKDGKIHVVMMNSFSKFANQAFQCEDKYTTQIDEILTGMQNDSYEIVDIKFNVLANQGLGGSMEGFNTLIMYK